MAGLGLAQAMSSQWASTSFSFSFSLCLCPQLLSLLADGQDIREYVRVRTAEIQERLLFSEDFLDHIVGTIAPAVNGMFLLARLHMDTLKSKTNVRDIADALQSFPDGYDGAYQAAMSRINNQDEGHQSLAKQVLMWVVCAKRPLLATELQHAVAIRSGDGVFRADGLTRVGLLIAVCAGLVAVRHSSLKAVTSVKTGMIVHLAHYTAQEYFDRTRDDWFPGAQLAMSQSCLSYLALKEFETVPCDDDVQLKSRLGQYPFLEYAAIFWGLHAALLKTDSDTHEWNVLQEAVVPFLQSPALCDTTIQVQTLWSWVFSGDPARTPRQSTACHLFARWGFGQLCDYCHDFGIDVSALDSEGKPPFYYALEKCPKSNVDTLLSWSRQTELSKYGSCALWHAVRHQEHQIIANLLALDSIDANARMFSNTPLICAAGSGHTKTVQTLLGCPKVDVTAVNDYGENALLCAVQNINADVDAHGDEKVDTILGARDVVADSHDSHDTTPMAIAGEGQDEIVSILLTKGEIKINHQDANGATALWNACGSGRLSTARILCECQGIDTNLPDFEGKTPLMQAIISGGTELIIYLSGRDEIDINVKDIQGRTALWYACEKGHSIVALLLAERSPMHLYAYDTEGYSPLTKIRKTEDCDLLDSGLVSEMSLVHRRDRFGYDHFHKAVLIGNIALTEWLLRNEQLNVDSRTRCGGTPLLLSARKGRTAIVKMLLQTMAVDLNAENCDGEKDLCHLLQLEDTCKS